MNNQSSTSSAPQGADQGITAPPPYTGPAAGLHLVSPRYLYDHHGLSLGNGLVIHRIGPGDAPTDGTVCVVTLAEFADGNPWRIQPHSNRRYSPAESVARARTKDGEVAYNVALNNCEHFVNWCIEGEHRSEQVRHVLDKSVTLAASLYAAAKGTPLITTVPGSRSSSPSNKPVKSAPESAKAKGDKPAVVETRSPIAEATSNLWSWGRSLFEE